VWGAVHGALLSLNHGWHQVRGALGFPASGAPALAGRAIGVVLPLNAVMLAWIPFRCADLASTRRMLASMLGPEAWVTSGDRSAAFMAWLARAPADWFAGTPPNLWGIDAGAGLPLIALGLAIVLLAPNSVEIVGASAVYQAGGESPAPPDGLAPGGGPRVGGAEAGNAGPSRSLWQWRPGLGWAVLVGVVLAASFLNLSRVSPFLYFQF